jgi:hypothetical protein
MTRRTDIAGYEGLYAITACGRVWAYPKKSRLRGRWLKQSLSNCGYPYVCLYKEGKISNKYVHRLLAKTLLSKVDGKLHVNHKNGIKTDNRLCNLEWCTPKENKVHAFSIGLKMKLSDAERVRRGEQMRKYNLRDREKSNG